MRDIALSDALAALSNGAGPVPWYATPPIPGDQPLRWCTSRDPGTSTLASSNMLLNENNAVFLLLPSSSYAQLIGPSQLLCWQSSKDSIVIRLFDTNAFEIPLAESIGAAREEVTERAKMVWASGLVCEEKIARTAGAERYAHAFPNDLKNIGEVLVLANGEHTQLYQMLPIAGEIAVYPQDWFNKGPYDFGYQWPAVVAREEKSQSVVGWGVRLGLFVLDTTLRDLKCWLYKDPFARYVPQAHA